MAAPSSTERMQDPPECEAHPLITSETPAAASASAFGKGGRRSLAVVLCLAALGTLLVVSRQPAGSVQPSAPSSRASAAGDDLVLDLRSRVVVLDEDKEKEKKAEEKKAEEEKAEEKTVEMVPVELPAGAPECGEATEDCSHSGCCKGDSLFCYSKGFNQGVAIGGASCQEIGNAGEVKWVRGELPKASHRTWHSEKHGVTCNSRFVPPEVPLTGTQHNGVVLAPTCYEGSGPHNVFIIGDWGGILPGSNGNIENDYGAKFFDHVAPADHTTFGGHMRDYAPGTDEWAQFRVAKAIKARAKTSRPQYFLNAGDAFYWGGVETHCGVPPYMYAHTGQWKAIFEDMYSGEGIDGVQWLGVLGNHDYGGWMYLSAWDQVIGYTWGGPHSTGRWMLPAQYYMAPVYYDDFMVEYYFIDTNVWDAMPSGHASGHNPCNGAKVGMSTSPTCGEQGPKSADECYAWFKTLWEDQKKWMDKVMSKSKAQWQIVVTHFPVTWGKEEWPAIARKHGIDLIITGHKHMQEVHVPEDMLTQLDGWSGLYSDFMGGTGWIVSGGGGGVTSQYMPDGEGNDDQYGFMELSLERYKITITSISHGGQVTNVKHLRPIPPAIPSPSHVNYLTREQVEMAKPNPNNCGTKKYTFYVYRAQDESQYTDTNVNAANLAGVLWYLHHEVVMVCPRKFGITRIRRLKITMQNTCDLYNDTKTQFGPYVAFDSGRCGVEGCEKAYYKYGSVIGCQHIPFNTGIFAAYSEWPNGGYARWYSLPGPCTKSPVKEKSKECIKEDPGGLCESVTGERDCTYSIEQAGDLSLDELYKTTSQWYPWSEFCKSQLEYNNKTDYGIGINWWNGIYNPSRCMARYKNITQAFKRKYPHFPENLPEPHCDYYKTDPGDYFTKTGSGFSRTFRERQLGW